MVGSAVAHSRHSPMRLWVDWGGAPHIGQGPRLLSGDAACLNMWGWGRQGACAWDTFSRPGRGVYHFGTQSSGPTWVQESGKWSILPTQEEK